jgi:hypothetical protein
MAIGAKGAWHETDHGTVTRNYDYFKDASDDIRRAQENGWNVKDVFVLGERLKPTEPVPWWKLAWKYRLVTKDDNVDLQIWPMSGYSRTAGVIGLVVGAVGLLSGGTITTGEVPVEVTYTRR